jgi:hypothetical protein
LAANACFTALATLPSNSSASRTAVFLSRNTSLQLETSRGEKDDPTPLRVAVKGHPDVRLMESSGVEVLSLMVMLGAKPRPKLRRFGCKAAMIFEQWRVVSRLCKQMGEFKLQECYICNHVYIYIYTFQKAWPCETNSS